MISDRNMLKIVYDITESDLGNASQKLDLISKYLNISPYQDQKVLHPIDCGCTECILNETHPAENELEYEIYYNHQWVLHDD